MNPQHCMKQLSDAQGVSLQELLDQKERRAQRQREMLTRGNALICFTLNIPGPVKRAPVLSLAFDEGCARITQQLRWHGIHISEQALCRASGGEELYILTSAPAERLKALMLEIENSFPLGRLMDIDVLARNGETLSREALGRPARTCLLCGERAAVCARSRAHSIRALQEEVVRRICGYFNGRYADTVAGLCTRALLYEAAVTPKPGLVDRDNSGAHRDMDIFTFMASAGALTPYFRDCVLRGIGGSRLSPPALFQSLRYAGRQAEADMARATGGVNTHKGAVFSMGILCAALGRLFDLDAPWDTADLFALCREMCAGLVEADMAALDESGPHTAGELLYARYGVGGARGEAAAGFPSVADIGLPMLKKCLAQGMDLNGAGVQTLLHLMARVEDTNMLRRAGHARAAALQQQLRARLDRGAVSTAEAAALDREWTALGVSPGGCADLLAMSFFLWLAETELLPRIKNEKERSI